ncbi:tryptophan--tRNA ligase [[Mycoplasma] testudinis]|uniref:tryptophan--tRNA ligase n=1 Tax=[Mycoplasma] testudinis TaxID=33924 RepID=UPI0004872C46|nr:tryptophan--tRNA ligase [[Mycoplasma] testudinis]
MQRIISGIQSSGRLHLGNYLGSLANFIKLQEKYELFIFVADLHSITVDFKAEELTKSRQDLVATYLAAGLDHQKVSIFLQSEVLEHPALGHIILCHTTLGELERMTQFKSKANDGLKQNNNTVKIPTGLLTYPTLMAADILLYQAYGVPVGADQKQHIELTRNIALRMNAKYGTMFKVPEPIIPEIGARVMDLMDANKKMSKSAKITKGVIFLDETPESLKAKIKSAKTDSLNQVIYNPKQQPEVANLLTIYDSLINESAASSLRQKFYGTKNTISMQEIEKKYHGKNYGVFKQDLYEIINSRLQQIQKLKAQFAKPEILKKILEKGKQKAQSVAQKTLGKVYELIGFKEIK